MGIGAIITRRTDARFPGVHLDSDGFPEEIGRLLWRGYHGPHHEDLGVLLASLGASDSVDPDGNHDGGYRYVLDELGMTITDSRTAHLDGWGYRTLVRWHDPEPRWDALRWKSVRGVWSREDVDEAARRRGGA